MGARAADRAGADHGRFPCVSLSLGGGVAHVESVEGGPGGCVGAACCRPLWAGSFLGARGIRGFFFDGVAVRAANLCSVHQVFERPKLQERPSPKRARRVRAARGEAQRRLVANFAEGMIRTRCGEAGLAKNPLAQRAHAGLVELANDESARDERQGHDDGGLCATFAPVWTGFNRSPKASLD